MIRRLRRRFIAVAMLSMFLVLSVIMGVVNGINYRNIAREADRVLAVLAENGGRFPREKRPSGKKMPPPRDLSPETPFESRFFTVTLDSQGAAASTDTGSIAAIGDGEAAQLAESVYRSGRRDGFIRNYRFLRLDTDSGAMIIFLDCYRSLENFRTFLVSSVLVSAAGLLSVLFLVVVFSKMVFKPVAESDRKQKQFITDAGHEIKTPLTIIDANTEVLEMEHGESQWTKSIRSQVKRLSALTADLIALSRLDEGAGQLQRLEFSLSDAVDETTRSFQALALTQGKTLEAQIPPNLTYRGDEASIRQLTGILLDNALKHSDERGLIRLSVRPRGRGGCVITVYNTVQSVEPGDLNLLFQRFYRADRSRNSQTGGYGLGLAIARAIVSAHKGKISAESRDKRSLTITVTL